MEEDLTKTPSSVIKTKSALYSCAISPSGDLSFYGERDGRACVFQTDEIPRAAERPKPSAEDSSSDPIMLEHPLKPGHVAEVLSSGFFPSGLVVFTGAADFSVGVYSALSGLRGQLLRGHKSAVLDVVPLGRGKRTISCAADGEIRLWRLAGAETLAKVSLGVAVNGVCVLNDGDDWDSDGKVVVVSGDENGVIRTFHVKNTSKVFVPLKETKICECACNSVCKLDNATVVVGFHSGVVAVLKINEEGDMTVAATIENVTSSPVSRITKCKDMDGRLCFVAGHNDGTLWKGSDDGKVVCHYYGTNGWPVTGLSVALDSPLQQMLVSTRDGRLLLFKSIN